jgi:ComF family protein
MKFAELIDDFVDLFYPQLCAGCVDPLLKNEDVICLNCLWEMPFAKLHDIEDNMIEQRLWGKVKFEAATSMIYYNKNSRIQRLLYALKYHGNKEVGVKLGELLGQELRKSTRFSDVDVVIPVPLHPKKQQSRGYNQCDLIAEGMAIHSYDSIKDNLIRTADNKTQTRKSIYSRWGNVRSIFELLRPEQLEGKHVLLIDDVITSGSTLEACAQAFAQCKDVKLSIAAVACAE